MGCMRRLQIGQLSFDFQQPRFDACTFFLCFIQLRAKLEARKAGGGTQVASDVPSWTSEKPLVSDEPVLVAPREGLDELEARAKQLSTAFRDQPAPGESRVERNAMDFPSGDHWGLDSDVVQSVSRRAVPPADGTIQTASLPPRADVHAPWPASGDHHGAPSKPGPPPRVA